MIYMLSCPTSTHITTCKQVACNSMFQTKMAIERQKVQIPENNILSSHRKLWCTISFLINIHSFRYFIFSCLPNKTPNWHLERRFEIHTPVRTFSWQLFGKQIYGICSVVTFQQCLSDINWFQIRVEGSRHPSQLCFKIVSRRLMMQKHLRLWCGAALSGISRTFWKDGVPGRRHLTLVCGQ